MGTDFSSLFRYATCSHAFASYQHWLIHHCMSFLPIRLSGIKPIPDKHASVGDSTADLDKDALRNNFSRVIEAYQSRLVTVE